MMTVEVLTGPPGCGKSTILRHEAVTQPARYIFAYPTLKLLREQLTAFQTEMPKTGVVLEAHGDPPGRGKVQKKLDAAEAQVAAARADHAILLTTHASLMSCDLTAFRGWHFRIDEAPTAIQSGTEKSMMVHSYLEQHFELDPIGQGGWHVVRIKPNASPTSWRAGSGLSDAQAELLNHAQRPNTVFVDVSEFSGGFRWVSVWAPHTLEGLAASVTIAGASYMTSIGALVAAPFVTLQPRPISMTRTGNPTIRIHYFTEGHEGSTSLWGRSEGRAHIVKLCDHLVANAPTLGFWGANGVVANLLEHRVPGKMIPPKAEGQNEYREEQSCAYVYSAKPTPDDEPLKVLFGLSDEQIRISREDNDVLQFVMRGAIRNPDFDGSYDIYLYSLFQAERVRGQLLGGHVGNVELHPADAGFMQVVVPRRDRPRPAPEMAVSRSGQKVKAASAKKSERRHAKALAAGRVPGRVGRPTKC